MSQLSDRLGAAVLSLAADGSVKQRLAHAYSQHLASLDEKDLPDGMRDDFARLKEALHRYPSVCGESAVEASVRKMSARQCEQQAACIVSLFAASLKTQAPAERLKVVKGRGKGKGGGKSASEPAAMVLDRLAVRDRRR